MGNLNSDPSAIGYSPNAALATLLSDSATARQDTATLRNNAAKIDSQTDELIQQVRDQSSNLLEGMKQQNATAINDANAVNNTLQNDAAVQAFKKGQTAMAPDMAEATAQYQQELHDYLQDNGGPLNEFVRGLTGRNLALEKLQMKGEVLKSATQVLGNLSQQAGADEILTKQLQNDQSAPQRLASQNLIDQADAYLSKVTPAINEDLRTKDRTSKGVAEASDQLASQDRNLYSTLIYAQNQNMDTAAKKASLELQNLSIAEQKLHLADALQNENFVSDISQRTGLTPAQFRSLPEGAKQAVANIATGIPAVSNLTDPAQVTTAAQAASLAAPDPIQKALAPYIGDALISYQQDATARQNLALNGQKAPPKNKNFGAVVQAKTDFLDNALIPIPGFQSPISTTDAISRILLDPAQRGQSFYNSDTTNAYAKSGAPGASIVQRIQGDMKTNPGVLRGGIDINYLKSIGATAPQVWDYYQYIRGQTISHSPYQIYGLQAPRANIGLQLDTINVGLFGTVTPTSKSVVPRGPEDIQKAYIELDAAKKAQDVNADVLKTIQTQINTAPRI